jgi:CcmD family protein
MGDLWYLALAYSVIWLGLVGYVLRLAGRAESLSREVSLLRAMLQADEAAAGEGEGGTVAASAGTRPGEARSEV